MLRAVLLLQNDCWSLGFLRLLEDLWLGYGRRGFGLGEGCGWKDCGWQGLSCWLLKSDEVRGRMIIIIRWRLLD